MCREGIASRRAVFSRLHRSQAQQLRSADRRRGGDGGVDGRMGGHEAQQLVGHQAGLPRIQGGGERATGGQEVAFGRDLEVQLHDDLGRFRHK